MTHRWFQTVASDTSLSVRECRRLTFFRGLSGGLALGLLTTAALIGFTIPDLIDEWGSPEALGRVASFAGLGAFVGVIAAVRAWARPVQWEVVQGVGVTLNHGRRPWHVPWADVSELRRGTTLFGRSRVEVVIDDENIYALGTSAWHHDAVDEVVSLSRTVLQAGSSQQVD